MSLQVWLPLNGDLHNQGLSNLIFIPTSYNTIDNDGKIGKCYNNNAPSWNRGGILSDSTIDLGINQSMFCWVNFTTLNSSASLGGGLVTQHNSSTNSGMSINIRYVSSTTGYATVSTGNGSSSTYKNYYGTTLLQAGTWYHLGYTYDGTTIKIYVNGHCEKTQAYTNMAVPANKIGIFGWSLSNNLGSFTLNGKLNDVRIYDHCLSPKEVEEISKGLVLHYKLDNNTNWLLPNFETVIVRASKNTFMDYDYYPDLITNTETSYIVDFYAKGSVNAMKMDVYFRNSNGSAYATTAQQTLTTDWKHYFLPLSGSPSSLQVFRARCLAGAEEDIIYIRNMRLLSNNMPIRDSIIYDSSGYRNNGIIVGSLTAAVGSPRYDVATVFDGLSAIKVNDNNWCSQGMKEMTINLWVKPTTAFTKIFSCTQDGGWNTEGGNSGYLRFPIHVYTNAEQTATAYKYDSKELQISAIPQNAWTMLTFIYDSSGTKTYINGELHHTYSNVSYGIHYNMNTRLFLGCEANTAKPASPYFTGQQNDFRIYATALTANQIKELYLTSMIVNADGTTSPRELVS